MDVRHRVVAGANGRVAYLFRVAHLFRVCRFSTARPFAKGGFASRTPVSDLKNTLWRAVEILFDD